MIETFGNLLLSSANYDIRSAPEMEQRNLGPLSDATPGTELYSAMTLGSPTYTGRSVNPNTAMAYTAVLACVKILSESLASLPLITHRNLGADYSRKEPAVNDYRFRLLREQPNREMTSFQWREHMMLSLTLWGNSYAFLDWNRSNGHLNSIWPLRADWVTVLRNEYGRLVYGYQPLSYYSNPVPAGFYEDWQILHVPGLGFDGSIGFSPITMARQAIGLGLAAEEFAGRFHANNARPNVVLTSTNAVADPAALRQAWHSAYGGLENTGKVAVLPPGMDIKTFSIDPKDAQFLEGREWQLGEIARIFGVPLNMLADVMGKASTYASAEQFDLGFAKHTIRPWATRIEQKIDCTVLGSQDALTCRHDMSDLMRGDSTSQAVTITSYVRGGVMTPNEGRARLDLNPSNDPQADKLIVQAQMVPLALAGADQQKPVDTTPKLLAA